MVARRSGGKAPEAPSDKQVGAQGAGAILARVRAAVARLARSDAFRWSLGCVVVWRLFVEACNQLLPFIADPLRSTLPLGLGRWSRWDSGWYVDVMLNGYHYAPTTTGQANFAFFPGFPYIVRWFSDLLGISPVAGGLILNVLLTVGCCFFVYRIALLLADTSTGQTGREQPARTIARLSVVALLVFPASMFFAALYGEALLVLAVTAAFYYVLRGSLWMATPFLILATATKSTALAVLPALALIVFLRWKRRGRPFGRLIADLVPIGLGVLGTLGYMAFLWQRFGDPLLLYKVQAGWGRNTGNFFLSELAERYYAHFFQPAYFGSVYTYVLSLFVMALPFLLVGMTVWVGRRYGMWWPLVLVGAVIALPLSTGVMESLNRYVLAAAPAIPLFIMLLYSRRRSLLYPGLVLSVLFLAACSLAFTHGGYFAG